MWQKGRKYPDNVKKTANMCKSVVQYAHTLADIIVTYINTLSFPLQNNLMSKA